MSEQDLQIAFSQIRMGDREAFGAVYRELSKPIFTVVLRIVRQRETAEDVTQDVFVKLFVTPPEASVRSLRAWIFRMARNLAIDALRKQHITQSDELPEDRAGEDDEVKQANTRMDVEQAMSRLPQTEREIVALHIHGELGFAEIARMEGMSLAAAYRAYRRALGRLREELGGNL